MRIDIQEFMNDISKRGRLLLSYATGAVVVLAPLKSLVMEGFQKELIALMTLALGFHGNTELALIFIFCISKYSAMTIRKTMS